MEFIYRLYIAVLSALRCKKGHKDIIKHKLTYNPTVHKQGGGGGGGGEEGGRACNQFLKRLVPVYQILVYLLIGQI